jgi:hypothetical protein
MARSRRKSPVFGMCCGSDTAARRNARRSRRRLAKVVMATLDPENCDDTLFPEVGEGRKDNPWDWPQDGRAWRQSWLDRAEDDRDRHKLMGK